MILELSLSILVSLIHYCRCFNFVNLHAEVMVISKFAQFEFKYGDAERGCTMFESLLSSYPRRIDLWSLYIDAMVKTGDVDKVR